jgi:hypothetical protein
MRRKDSRIESAVSLSKLAATPYITDDMVKKTNSALLLNATF